MRFLAAFFAALACTTAAAQSAIDSRTYTHPNTLVRIDGARRLNMLCMGSGSPIVLFDSGAGGGLYVWAKVQARVAAFTRACSYDRAGFGHSDPPRRPATIANNVDDMHRLVELAHLDGPLVLVGHSRAGFDTRLYIHRYPKNVKGLLLLDPLAIGVFSSMWFAYTPKQQAGLSKMKVRQFAGFDKCVALAKRHRLTRKADADCFDDIDDPVLQAELDRQDARLETQKTIRSEILNANPLDAAAETPDEREMRVVPTSLGDRPLIVLTATKGFAKETAIKAEGHRQIAAFSTRGKLVPVATDHDIGWEDPNAVVDAVREVVEDTRR